MCVFKKSQKIIIIVACSCSVTGENCAPKVGSEGYSFVSSWDVILSILGYV
jgi:hypothetical protein